MGIFKNVAKKAGKKMIRSGKKRVRKQTKKELKKLSKLLLG